MSRSLKKNKILHLGLYYPPERGGIETVAGAMCEGLAPDYNVEAIVHSRTGLPSLERRNDVLVRRLRTWLRVANTPISPQLGKAIREAKAELVHVHHPFPTAMASLMVMPKRSQWICSWHADIHRFPVLAKAIEPVFRAFLKRCSAILVSSQYLIDRSEMLAPVREKCVVLPFGVKTPPPAEHSAAAVEALKAKYGERIIVAVGRLVPYKGHRFLIEAMEDLDATCLIIGTGPLEPVLRAQIESGSAHGRVHLLGEVADLDPYYRAARVLAFPSTGAAETFGVAQIEAMIRGCPVVNTEIDSAVKEVSRHGETGLTVPPNEAAPLRAALKQILDDRDLRDRLGRAAQRRAQDLYSADAMIRGLKSVYSKALDPRTP